VEQHLLEEPIIWFVAALLCLLGLFVLDVIVKSTSQPAEQPAPPAKEAAN